MESNEDSKFEVRTVKVEKGAAFEDGRIHRTMTVGFTAEVIDSNSTAFVVSTLERNADLHIARAIESAMHKPFESTPTFEIDELSWKYSQGKKGVPLQLIGIADSQTKELANLIRHGMSEYNGFSYWIFKDNTTIGRRKIA